MSTHSRAIFSGLSRLVAAITGSEFGATNFVSRIVYVLVGAAGLWLFSLLARGASNEMA